MLKRYKTMLNGISTVSFHALKKYCMIQGLTFPLTPEEVDKYKQRILKEVKRCKKVSKTFNNKFKCNRKNTYFIVGGGVVITYATRKCSDNRHKNGLNALTNKIEQRSRNVY